MKIADREIGYGHPVFIVAEIGPNHCGRLELARQLVRAAKDAGADACKFQLYRPDEMTLQSDHPRFRITSGPWAGRTLWDLYTEGQTPREWMPELFELARSIGIIPFASVFSPDGVAFLETLECPAYKIASAEVEHLDLVRAVARTLKPIIMSDGMATAEATRDAHWEIGTTSSEVIRSDPDWRSNPQVEGFCIELRCVSEYPAESYGFADLMNECDPYSAYCGRKDGFWGLSDHSRTPEAAITAVALGACMVEAHLMLDRQVYGYAPEWGRNDKSVLPLDWAHSQEPGEFEEYVATIRRVETMLRTEHKPSESAEQWRRRPIVVVDGETRWLRCGPAPIRCLDCSMPFVEPPPDWKCTHCSGPVSQQAGVIPV